MNNTLFKIRDIKIEDKNDYYILFQGYANFYQVEINDNIINTVWKWLHTPEHELQGIIGEINNKVIAFATPMVREVDTKEDFKYIEFEVSQNQSLTSRLF